ncbi:LLM class flavin-dependent oxidoreductase [Actinomadura madurae]|uniref:LLM class flavin-dependent oxidoreductase n=1 Tax=Actinomadura madurae TaxID=1993 RepID=UPI0020D25549|nr:LLM class flavin-dependent oxidoreductase [Actinomadura madurae]MCQ0008346.1 LLM class flavin-dependent oxidoreductase [Actinomadura madurae]
MLDAALRERLSLSRLAAVAGETPARILGLAAKGRIAVGCDADLVLADPESDTTIDEQRLHSKAGWSPFHGRRLRGGSSRRTCAADRSPRTATSSGRDLGGVSSPGGPLSDHPRRKGASVRIGLHYSFQAGPDESASAVIDDGLTDIAAADDAGFSSVVFAEHHFLDDGWLPRPMMLAAAAAAVTRRMRIGTDIVILALHHPVAVAEEAAVLDVMSGGRAILGVGLGWIEREFAGFGVPYARRAKIYQESIDVVRRLLRGELVDHEGHHSFRGARISPLPVNPDGVPLWMGALEDPGVRRAARSGDAWVMPPGNRLERLVAQKRLFDDTRALAGLLPVGEQPLRREVFVAETDARAWELFAPGIRHEYGNVYRPLHPTYPDDDSIDNLRAWGEGLFLVGSPETVATELVRYKEQLSVTECLVRCQLPGIPGAAVKEALAGLAEVIALLDPPR